MLSLKTGSKSAGIEIFDDNFVPTIDYKTMLCSFMYTFIQNNGNFEVETENIPVSLTA